MYNFYTILCIFYIFIHFGLTQEVNTQKNIVEFNPGSKLHMKVYDLKRNDYQKCGGPGQFETRCESQGKPTLEIACEIVNYTQGDNLAQFINASTTATVLAEQDGNWQCTFALTYIENNKKNYDKINIQATFKLCSIKVDEVIDPKWKYIGGAIGALAVVVIVTQTGCILYFKKKARGRKRLESLQSSPSVDSPDNTVRYTKMPGQIKMEQLNMESRESAIYEALENFPIPTPEPPPIDTLPRLGKTNNETQQLSLTSKTLPPPTAKKPVKNKDIDKRNENTMSISSLKRIKSRKPQALPMDEPPMYEVMTPPDTLKKPESGLNRTLPGKAQFPSQAVPIFPTGNNVHVLPSMIAAAQLKSGNKLNQITAPHKPKLQPIPEPKKPAPFALNAIKKTVPPGFRPPPGALPIQPSPPVFRKQPVSVPIQPSQPVFRKPPAPLPIQPLPVNNGSISSDEEEWTYEPLSRYTNEYNIYDNIPR